MDRLFIWWMGDMRGDSKHEPQQIEYISLFFPHHSSQPCKPPPSSCCSISLHSSQQLCFVKGFLLFFITCNWLFKAKSHIRPLFCLVLPIPLCLPPFLPFTYLSGGIFLALLHSFLLNCQVAAAAAAISTLLPLSAHNLVLLATPPLSHTLHMVNPTCKTHESSYCHSYLCLR